MTDFVADDVAFIRKRMEEIKAVERPNRNSETPIPTAFCYTCEGKGWMKKSGSSAMPLTRFTCVTCSNIGGYPKPSI